MQTFALSHSEESALRIALTGHDMNFLNGRCDCGRTGCWHDEPRAEHLLEVAFRAGEEYARIKE